MIEFQARRCGILGDIRRILESFNILLAKHTRAVVGKNRHLKQRDMYKAELHRDIMEFQGIDLLKKEFQVFPNSQANTSETEFPGREVLYRSRDNTSKAKLQG